MSTPTKIAIVDKSSGAPAVPSGGGLVAAIAAVMTEVHTVAKRGVNEFHRYQYATMGDILKEITPLLGKHGIVIFQSETGRAMFDEDNVIAIEYAFTVAHASGEIWPHAIKQTGVSTCRNSKGGWDDKSLNKCHTAARKYFLLALCQIPTGDEADADQGENERPTKQIVRPTYVVPPVRRAPSSRAASRNAPSPSATSRPFDRWARRSRSLRPRLADSTSAIRRLSALCRMSVKPRRRSIGSSTP